MTIISLGYRPRDTNLVFKNHAKSVLDRIRIDQQITFWFDPLDTVVALK